MTDKTISALIERESWPRFYDIPEPRMIAFFTGNGSGSKLFQGFVDGHPELYMVPGYMLMYLYPHWEQWKEELANCWTWEKIVEAFCINHASVLDTRRIPGFDGLAELGESQSEHIEINEDLFRAYLLHLLQDEPIRSRTFVLAVHYAYAKCRGDDIGRMKAVFFHIHVHKYVVEYLAPDFPDMQIIAMVRDPRSNLSGRFWSSAVAVDKSRLNVTDAAIYLPRTYNYVIWEQLNGLDILNALHGHEIRVVRHEDLYYAPLKVMEATARFIGISNSPCFNTVTFGGKLWWGDTIYGEQPKNAASPSIVSGGWKERIAILDWFVLEGVFFDYMKKYGYDNFKYRRDSLWERALLLFALFVPSRIETEIWSSMFRPSRLLHFLGACLDEAAGRVALKKYDSNAYYRHKWTVKPLQIWKPRFFREFLRRSLARAQTAPRGSGAVATLRAAQALYVLVNVARYAMAALSWPVHMIGRTRLYLAAYRRRLQGRVVLPEMLR